MEVYSEGLECVVIVGGGLIGIEMVEMFYFCYILVIFLVRELAYWNVVLFREEFEMVICYIWEYGIDFCLFIELKEIEDDGEGRVCVVIIGVGEWIDCGYVGFMVGVYFSISWLKEMVLEMDKGILVDDYLQINLLDVYVIGDCVQICYFKFGCCLIEVVWYMGCMMGEIVVYIISGWLIEYDLGIWFNFVKFMDIEYQVYGDVSG